VEKEVIKEVPVEVEKIVEVPVYQSQSIDEEDDYFDDESELIDIQDNMITQSETIEEEPVVDDTPKPNRLSYVKP
jgi:hypothetical protein